MKMIIKYDEDNAMIRKRACKIQTVLAIRVNLCELMNPTLLLVCADL